MLREVSQTEKDKHICFHLYVESKDQNERAGRTEADSWMQRTDRQSLGVGAGGGG